MKYLVTVNPVPAAAKSENPVAPEQFVVDSDRLAALVDSKLTSDTFIIVASVPEFS